MPRCHPRERKVANLVTFGQYATSGERCWGWWRRFDQPAGVARAVAVGVVRRGLCAAGGRAPGQGPRGVRIGAAGIPAVMVAGHGRRTAGGRGRRKLEHGGRRGRGTAARNVVGRRGHAQRRAPGRRVIRRGRRTGGTRRRSVVRVRERVDVSQVTADDGPRLVGRLGAGRPPARLMVIRRGGHRLLLLQLVNAGDGAAAAVVVAGGHVHGRLGPGRA